MAEKEIIAGPPLWRPQVIWPKHDIIVAHDGRVGNMETIAYPDMAFALHPGAATLGDVKEALGIYRTRQTQELQRLRALPQEVLYSLGRRLINAADFYSRPSDLPLHPSIRMPIEDIATPSFFSELFSYENSEHVSTSLSGPDGMQYLNFLLEKYNPLQHPLFSCNPETLYGAIQSYAAAQKPERWVDKACHRFIHRHDAYRYASIDNALAASPRLYALISTFNPFIMVGGQKVLQWAVPEKMKYTGGCKTNHMLFLQERSRGNHDTFLSTIQEEGEHFLNDKVGYGKLDWFDACKVDRNKKTAKRFFKKYSTKPDGWIKDYKPLSFAAEYIAEVNMAYDTCLLEYIHCGLPREVAEEKAHAEMKEALPVTYPLFVEYRKKEREVIGEIAAKRAEASYESIAQHAAEPTIRGEHTDALRGAGLSSPAIPSRN